MNKQHSYPEPKVHDMSDDAKRDLRNRVGEIEHKGGHADVYELADEFGCSASQVAGIKAAMHRR